MTNLQTLVQTLKQQGKTDKEIVAVVQATSQAALIKSTRFLMETISDQPEAAEIEKITDEVEGQKKLIEFYEKKTGQNYEQLANNKLEEAAKEYLDSLG